MSFLIKYIPNLGLTTISDPNDIFPMKGIILGGYLFDNTNIAQVSALISVSGSLESDIQGVSGTVNAAGNQLNIFQNQQNHTNSNLSNQVSASFENTILLAKAFMDELQEEAVEEVIIAVSGHTVFNSVLTWNPSVTSRDVLFFKNGVKLNQSTSVSGYDFWKNSSNQLQTAFGVQAGDRMCIRQDRPNSSNIIKSFWVEYVSGKIGRAVPFANKYNPGSDRLWLFRNGIHLAKTKTLGDAADQYEEVTNSFASLINYLDPSDVVAAVNIPLNPTYRYYEQGVSGNVIPVPGYSVGTKRLLVWRNGILLNAQALGDFVDRYTESTSGSITVSASAGLNDLFIFENLNSITWRQDQILPLGSVLTFSNTYNVGDGKLLLFRDGILMLNSTLLGDPIDRYQEISVSSVGLSRSASGEVFSAIYL